MLAGECHGFIRNMKQGRIILLLRLPFNVRAGYLNSMNQHGKHMVSSFASEVITKTYFFSLLSSLAGISSGILKMDGLFPFRRTSYGRTSLIPSQVRLPMNSLHPPANVKDFIAKLCKVRKEI